MSTTAIRSSAAAAAGSTAPVLEYLCLFTHDLRRKQKRWQDGRLKYHTFNKRVMAYDDRGNFIGDMHWRADWEFDEGEEIQLERGSIIVQVSECVGQQHQDLSAIIDKRVQEREQRQKEKEQRLARTPATRLPVPVQRFESDFRPEHAGASNPPIRRRSINAGISTPIGHHGRAVVPSESPFEQRRRTDESAATDHTSRASKRRRYDITPPSQLGFAQSLFGTTLTLSNVPQSSNRGLPKPTRPLIDDTLPRPGTVLAAQPSSPEPEEYKVAGKVSSSKRDRAHGNRPMGYAQGLFGTPLSLSGLPPSSSTFSSRPSADQTSPRETEARPQAPLPSSKAKASDVPHILSPLTRGSAKDKSSPLRGVDDRRLNSVSRTTRPLPEAEAAMKDTAPVGTTRKEKQTSQPRPRPSRAPTPKDIADLAMFGSDKDDEVSAPGPKIITDLTLSSSENEDEEDALQAGHISMRAPAEFSDNADPFAGLNTTSHAPFESTGPQDPALHGRADVINTHAGNQQHGAPENSRRTELRFGKRKKRGLLIAAERTVGKAMHEVPEEDAAPKRQTSHARTSFQASPQEERSLDACPQPSTRRAKRPTDAADDVEDAAHKARAIPDRCDADPEPTASKSKTKKSKRGKGDSTARSDDEEAGTSRVKTRKRSRRGKDDSTAQTLEEQLGSPEPEWKAARRKEDQAHSRGRAPALRSDNEAPQMDAPMGLDVIPAAPPRLVKMKKNIRSKELIGFNFDNIDTSTRNGSLWVSKSHLSRVENQPPSPLAPVEIENGLLKSVFNDEDEPGDVMIAEDAQSPQEEVSEELPSTPLPLHSSPFDWPPTLPLSPQQARSPTPIAVESPFRPDVQVPAKNEEIVVPPNDEPWYADDSHLPHTAQSAQEAPTPRAALVSQALAQAVEVAHAPEAAQGPQVAATPQAALVSQAVAQAVEAAHAPQAVQAQQVAEKLQPTEGDVVTCAATLPQPETMLKERPRLANPATRGRKAALKSHAAGQVPQSVLPPVTGVQVIYVTRRDIDEDGGATACDRPAPKIKMKLPGFTSARETGPWSREAHDLLETTRPD